jgi:integrase
MEKSISDNNNYIINEFLDTISSQQFRNNVKYSLKHFFNHDNKEKWVLFKSVFDINISDLHRYNTYINKYSEWSHKTKITKFSHVKKFVKYLIKNYADKFDKLERLEFKADLSDKNLFLFDKEHKHKQPKTAYKRLFMTKQQVMNILNYLDNYKHIYYLMFRLIAESGLRKGELLSINIERNVEGKIIPIEDDLDNRKIRVMGKTGLLIYPITADMRYLLIYYLANTRSKYYVKDENGQPFFVSQKKHRFNKTVLNNILMGTNERKNDEGKIISIGSDGILKKLAINDHITPQTFRRTLNQLRISIGCPDKWCAILLNHKIKSDSDKSSVNIDYYQDNNFDSIIIEFDKWNPYQNKSDNVHL